MFPPDASSTQLPAEQLINARQSGPWLMAETQREWVAVEAIAAIAGIFLLVGLWTPIAGALLTLTELCIAFTATNHLRSTILLATIGIALAVLGPGAHSIDALLFGRKRLDI